MKKTSVRKHSRKLGKGKYISVRKHDRIIQKKGKDYISKKLQKELGVGEYSVAYYVDDYVIKKSKDVSKFNPKNFSKESFRRISKNEMKSEIKTYHKLNREKKYSILPKTMIGFHKGNDYYIIREYGDIPIAEGQENVFLPEWQKGKVTQKNYNKFLEEVFDITENYGYFDDTLQPAIRKDGTLFLSDLGHFRSKPFKDMTEHEKSIEINYFMHKVVHFNNQLTKELKLTIPDSVTDFKIDYHSKRAKERDFLQELDEEQRDFWIDVKKTRDYAKVIRKVKQ